MRIRSVCTLGLMALATLAADRPAVTAAEPSLKTLREKASYAIGQGIGRNMKANGVDIDPAILSQSISDALSDKKPAMTDDEIRETMAAFGKELGEKQKALAAERGASAKKDGENFLAANKSKEGVKTLPSGLQYKVIKEGAGASPKATDNVSTHYEGRLIDGTVFDSSYKRGEPTSFPVNGVIRGWTEALQLMKVGSKWQLYIPSNLAYGAEGAGGDIPPNSTLVFDIELLDVKPGRAAPEAVPPR